MTKKSSLIVGWRETAALPDWDIPGILAKIDTGARTSAIHVERINTLAGGWLRFEVVVQERPTVKRVEVEAKPVRWTKVRPSSGERQVRPVVLTAVQLGDWVREVEVSLIRRRGMLCRMLLGRTALEDVLVDPSRRYLATEPLKKKKKRRSS